MRSSRCIDLLYKQKTMVCHPVRQQWTLPLLWKMLTMHLFFLRIITKVHSMDLNCYRWINQACFNYHHHEFSYVNYFVIHQTLLTLVYIKSLLWEVNPSLAQIVLIDMDVLCFFVWWPLTLPPPPPPPPSKEFRKKKFLTFFSADKNIHAIPTQFSSDEYSCFYIWR